MRRTTSVLAAALLLVGGANLVVYAANGKPLLLGRSNTETKTSVVVNKGSGPALKLKTKASSPPLSVTSQTKVARLNADRLDGLDSEALRTTVHSYTLPSVDGQTSWSFSMPGLPAGKYLVNYYMYFDNNAAGAYCYFEDATQPGFVGFTQASHYAETSSVVGSLVYDTTKLGKFACDSNEAATTDACCPSQVNFLPIEVYKPRAATLRAQR